MGAEWDFSDEPEWSDPLVLREVDPAPPKQFSAPKPKAPEQPGVLARASAPVDDFLPGEAPVATPTFQAAADRSWDRLNDIVAPAPAPAPAPTKASEPEADPTKPQRVGVIDIRFVDVW